MIRLNNLEKFYQAGAGRTYVLRNINLEIAEGEFVSIMGPSGAGKSTLLAILGMLDDSWGGEYHLLGNPVHQVNRNRRRELSQQNIGFVFQSYHLLDDLTVYENLEVPLSYKNVKKSERDAMVCDILDRFRIVGKRDLFPSQLSGGQQQLVGVARAVISNPKLLLADEPTGNLDPDSAAQVLSLLRVQVKTRNAACILVTHSQAAAATADRIVILTAQGLREAG